MLYNSTMLPQEIQGCVNDSNEAKKILAKVYFVGKFCFSNFKRDK